MSSKAESAILEFNEAIDRKVAPGDYGPISDENLTAIAAESFALLEQEENRASLRET